LRTLESIRSRKAEPVTINYLEHSVSISESKNIFGKLQMGARGILRNCEPDFHINPVSRNYFSEYELKVLLTKFPSLIERPIGVTSYMAVICRPPENVPMLLP
jgi:arsenate reductase